MTEKLLAIPEVAKRLGVSTRTVYAYIKGRFTTNENGEVISKYPCILIPDYLPGGDMRISISQLKRFIRRSSQSKIESEGREMIRCPNCGYEF